MNFDMASYGRWTVTERGRAVLKGAHKVELRRETLDAVKASSRKEKKTAGSAPAREFAGDDHRLFDALKAMRLTLAKEERVPAYVIMTDRSLIDMVHLKPERRDQMMMVHGVGQAKLEKYGDTFLAVIREHRAAA
jgi:ATP-dependent DNA helicase RecQ